MLFLEAIKTNLHREDPSGYFSYRRLIKVFVIEKNILKVFFVDEFLKDFFIERTLKVFLTKEVKKGKDDF